MVKSLQCGHWRSYPDTGKLNLQWIHMMQPWKGAFKRKRMHTTDALGTWIKLLTSLALGPPLPLKVLSLQSWLCRERGKGDRLLHFLCRRIVTWRGSSDRVPLLGSSDRDYRPQWELSRRKDHKGQSVGGWPELSKGLEQEMDKGLALLFLVGIP